jgi:hypothetical protein
MQFRLDKTSINKADLLLKLYFFINIITVFVSFIITIMVLYKAEIFSLISGLIGYSNMFCAFLQIAWILLYFALIAAISVSLSFRLLYGLYRICNKPIFFIKLLKFYPKKIKGFLSLYIILILIPCCALMVINIIT